jgi:broad specificity phosphatase PhoE
VTRPAVTRLLLLRHGQIASHRGDVPVTAEGLATAAGVGGALAAPGRRVRVLSGNTLRTRQTAQAIADGARHAGGIVDGPTEAFALRNPDLYLAGTRVDMVSTAAAFAEQVPGMSEEDVARAPFYAAFVAAPDRIGWWLRHPSPPGDDTPAVRKRVTDFAVSLTDYPGPGPDLAVAVTHSPIIRACALSACPQDPGEPPWVGGIEITVSRDGAARVSWLGAISPAAATPGRGHQVPDPVHRTRHGDPP